jgi:hypothetical protein
MPVEEQMKTAKTMVAKWTRTFNAYSNLVDR